MKGHYCFASRDVTEDRCALASDCEAAFETTVVGWSGGIGWVYDACWRHARQLVDWMTGWGLTDPRDPERNA